MTTADHRDLHPVSLSISLVCYKSDPDQLLATLHSLREALHFAEPKLTLTAELTLVDNGDDTATLHKLLQLGGLAASAQVISNLANSGFGTANNQVIRQAHSDFHLVLNPDVELQMDALAVAIGYLQQHQSVVAVSPACKSGDGAIEFLCKRYPGVWVLLLRGFAPRWLKSRFQPALAHYEYQELAIVTEPATVELISGCFILCRTQALQRVGGFDEAYFLYFEDFALSLALARIGELHYLPACHIVHHGGKAASKGLQHIRYFLRSAWHFYRCHGWKLW